MNCSWQVGMVGSSFFTVTNLRAEVFQASGGSGFFSVSHRSSHRPERLLLTSRSEQKFQFGLTRTVRVGRSQNFRLVPRTLEGHRNMTKSSNLRVAVIGGGPGGSAAAFLAADLGMQVTLIDPEANPGGVCLYRGCIPSKALLHVAKLIEESRQAKNWGIEFPAPTIDLARLRTWKEGVVKKLTGGLGQLSKQRHLEYIQGRAAFENSTTLRISKADSS